METPEHERRSIEDYLRSQSGDDFQVEHVEKLTSEYVMGREYDVWDAHTNEGRWWVITNPTNLYSQDAIKSMDVALSFHVGLMSRVLSSQPQRQSEAPDRWILDVLRRLDVASSSLDRAEEVEDYQSVGMRLREALLALAERLADLGVVSVAPSELPKRGDFKAWAALVAGVLAPGSESEKLRGLLKATSEKTWAYVNWLTHFRRATELDARLALASTTQVVDGFITAITRWRAGAPDRCPVCGSSRLAVDYSGEEWSRLCNTCGWEAPAVAPTSDVEHHGEEELTRPSVEGECVIIEDFGIYLTPDHARLLMDDAAARMRSEDEGWANPFAFIGADGTVMDAHRAALAFTQGDVPPGVELVYGCGNDGCVNPEHAVEKRLPATEDWVLAVVEGARVDADHIRLTLSSADATSHDLFVERSFLDRFGIGDVSVLPERLLLLSPPDGSGRVHIAPVERRVDYGESSIAEGWLYRIGG